MDESTATNERRHRRDAIRMTPTEVHEFLGTIRTVQMSTINADGSPHLVPMFFVVRQDRITCWTYRSSKKAHNLRRDARIACLVESGHRTEELCGVQINGVARLSDEPSLVLEVGRDLHERYVGPVDHTAVEGIVHNAKKRVIVIVEPLIIVSWDHRKLQQQRPTTR